LQENWQVVEEGDDKWGRVVDERERGGCGVFLGWSVGLLPLVGPKVALFLFLFYFFSFPIFCLVL
jgi:hypothetical protein